MEAQAERSGIIKQVSAIQLESVTKEIKRKKWRKGSIICVNIQIYGY